MKRFAMFGLLLLGGCVVQSFHPFYEENAKVALPQLAGEWDLIADGTNTKPACTPWVFTDEGELITRDDKNLPGKLRASFFKVGGQLFCDLEAGDLEEGRVNVYWMLHVRPVHTVCKAQLTDRELTLVPLHFNWFKKALVSREIELPHLTARGNDVFLVTATTDQWRKFLQQHAADTNAFPQNTAYLLRKRPR